MVHRPAASEGGDLLVRGGRLPAWSLDTAVAHGRIEPGQATDVRIAGGTIAEVGAKLEQRGEDVLDVAGALLLPGLHDHHLHLRAAVAAARSVMAGPPDVRARDELAVALQRAPSDQRGWRRAVGYHESVAGELDRHVLDALAPGGPLRVQHRSGVMWVVNSPGAETLRLAERDLPGIERDDAGAPTGRLFRLDRWLATQWGDDDPIDDVAEVSWRLAARGVTGVTDATPDADPPGVAALVGAVARGTLRQRLHVMAAPGVELPPHPLVSRGPQKVMLDDDHLPGLEELAETMRRGHEAGVGVAVHCVTAAQLALALSAFASAGATADDRIEHGSVIAPAFVAAIADLGLTVVTNPGFVHERGDRYVDEVDARDVPHLYPCASLLAAGASVAAGSDAPFGPLDPWVAVRAAVTRRTCGGRVLGAGEAVPLRHALGLLSGSASAPGRPRRLTVREPGDLCVLVDGAVLGSGQPAVLATVVAGRVVYVAD